MMRTVTVKTRRSSATSHPTHDHDNGENVSDDDEEEEDVGECVVMYRLPRYLRVHSSWHLAPSATQLQHHHRRHVLELFKNDLISEGGGVKQTMTKDDRQTGTSHFPPHSFNIIIIIVLCCTFITERGNGSTKR